MLDQKADAVSRMYPASSSSTSTSTSTSTKQQQQQLWRRRSQDEALGGPDEGLGRDKISKPGTRAWGKAREPAAAARVE